jgi:tRNA/rRNA methyltransferase
MAGTNRTQPPIVGGPRIILIEPQLAENIGATARAMLNCGLTDLAIVNPRQKFPHPRAEAMASGANEVLDKAQLFDSVEDAIAGLNRVYATTARPRELTVRVTTPRRAAGELRTAWQVGEAVGILFGPERSGMVNEHIALADTVISVPLNPAYSSLNLAQAVLIMSYEWFTAEADTPDEQLIEPDTRPATKSELVAFFSRFEAALDTGGFFRAPEMRPAMVRNLRLMLQRANLTEQEVRTLHGVVSCLTESWRHTPNQRRYRQSDDS